MVIKTESVENSTNDLSLSEIFNNSHKCQTMGGDIIYTKLKKIFGEINYIDRINLRLVGKQIYNKIYNKLGGEDSARDTLLKYGEFVRDFLPSDHNGKEGLKKIYLQIRANILNAGGSGPTFHVHGYKLNLGDGLYIKLNGKYLGTYSAEEDILEDQVRLTFTYESEKSVKEDLVETLQTN